MKSTANGRSKKSSRSEKSNGKQPDDVSVGSSTVTLSSDSTVRGGSKDRDGGKLEKTLGNFQRGVRTVLKNSPKRLRELTVDDFLKSKLNTFEEFRLKEYSPLVFAHFRQEADITTEEYAASLCSDGALRQVSSRENAQSIVLFSPDHHYVVKEISKSECRFLRKILSHYWNHVQVNIDTLLARYYGLYRITSSTGDHRFLVMQNIFDTEKSINECYDLNGTPVRRGQKGKGNLRKDEDLKEKFQLNQDMRAALIKQFQFDCKFLSGLGITDYSILLGVHYTERKLRTSYPQFVTSRKDDESSDSEDGEEDSHRRYSPHRVNARSEDFSIFQRDSGGLACSLDDGEDVIIFLGIVDILHTYTAKKQGARFFKEIVYGKGSVSALEPRDFSARLRSFVEDLFVEYTPRY